MILTCKRFLAIKLLTCIISMHSSCKKKKKTKKNKTKQKTIQTNMDPE